MGSHRKEKALSLLANLGRRLGTRGPFGIAHGFYAFADALLVRAEEGAADALGVAEWNQPRLWKAIYPTLDSDIVFFAEDLFGCQFGRVQGRIVLLEAETGEVEEFAADLDEWAQRILDDPDVLTGRPLAVEWRERHGPLKPSFRLVPRIPFVLGGAFEIDNLVEKGEVEAMRIRGGIATMLRGVPDGATVEFVKRRG